MIYNFSAGPAVIFKDVLHQFQTHLVDYKGMGYSLLEASHRGPVYSEVHQNTTSLMKETLGLGENYEVLFLGGGATLQFSMIPYNFLKSGMKAQYIVSGVWAKKALSDARKIGNVDVIYDGADHGYNTLPQAQDIVVDSTSTYVHMTTNETIGGVQWKEDPMFSNVPIVADMSSDILSRPIDANAYSLIYAGAQKNIGPSGVTVVIIRKDFLDQANESLPAYLSYKTHADADSLYNTPPVFAIWMIQLVLEHIKTLGGLSEIEKNNQKKAALLYTAIADSDGYYHCPVDVAYQSLMNVVFRLPSEELEKQFIAEASKSNLLELKGHRSVGGCRASIYNAMPLEGVHALVDFMKKFRTTH